jgi:hypothetical protein
MAEQLPESKIVAGTGLAAGRSMAQPAEIDTRAFSIDYELSAVDEATLRSCLDQLGLAEVDHMSGNRYTVLIYGKKVVNNVPVPGYFAILRWIGATALGARFPPPGVTLPAGLTSISLPADTPIKFDRF